MTRPTTRWVARTAALAVLAVSLAACGSEEEPAAEETDQEESTEGGESEAAALVPADIAESGTVRVGTDASYAPNEFFDVDGETIIGMDIDLFDAVATELGLEAEYQSADFASTIPSVNSDTYDVGVSSFTVNEKRMLEANMVSYFDAGTQWAVAAGNPQDVDPGSPCGLTLQQYEGQDQATSALVSGKADAMSADSPVVSYAVKP